ncbi:hypothetical protein L5D93_22870 [Paenibacillus thiaminolyticus]|nr:hypothetical protein [Paenibacillus thiaminolyticus]
MTSNRSSRIQQQIYTRERRGIFRPNEGFDTIAASGGLDTGFIKKVLHPFCVYDAPAELASRGEKDEARYPQALHLFHADMGQLVLGRSIYQTADFTGLRSAFFTHNFIVPAERAADAVKDYPSLLNADFASSYDIEQGTELPELERIPARAEASRPASPTALLASLGIDEKMFKQLLFAVMSSVVTRRKVFVALDVAVEELSETALQLVGVLYGSLPYAYRRALGFLTFSKEPQSRKGIHLTFVEQGSLRPNDRNIDKDYTFDLASKRVTNVDIDLGEAALLELRLEQSGAAGAGGSLLCLPRADGGGHGRAAAYRDRQLPRVGCIVPDRGRQRFFLYAESGRRAAFDARLLGAGRGCRVEAAAGGAVPRMLPARV